MRKHRSLRGTLLVGTAIALAVSGASLATASPGATTAASALIASTPTATEPVLNQTGSIVVRDISIPVEGMDPVAAWLVEPAKASGHANAGILWLHWLGEIHGDRSEFLAETIGLASEGTVSIVPQGTFPWTSAPGGTFADVDAVKAQVTAFRAALDALEANPGVDRSRVAVVGHDYGAMYGSLAAAADGHVAAMVLAAPDATWSNWFAKFWLGYDDGNVSAAYTASFAGLDPVDHVANLGSHVLLQWAGDDFYIPAAVRNAFAAAAPEAQAIVYAGVDHEFTTRAQVDRDAFLRTQLGLS